MAYNDFFLDIALFWCLKVANTAIECVNKIYFSSGFISVNGEESIIATLGNELNVDWAFKVC